MKLNNKQRSLKLEPVTTRWNEAQYEGEEYLTTIKVDRVCPRCRAHRYHWYSKLTGRCCCAECSHEWNGRIKPSDV